MREGSIPPELVRHAGSRWRTASMGDIDTLANRIAHIRTWTFAANRPDWLADPEHWQGRRAWRGGQIVRTRCMKRLAERFVDRRTSVLMRRLRGETQCSKPENHEKLAKVVCRGAPRSGQLLGFQFAADAASAGPEAKGRCAPPPQKALAGRDRRGAAAKLGHAPRRAVSCSASGRHAALAGRAGGGGSPAGDEVLRPAPARILSDEQSDRPLARCRAGAARSLAQERIWKKLLGPLFALASAEGTSPASRARASHSS